MRELALHLVSAAALLVWSADAMADPAQPAPATPAQSLTVPAAPGASSRPIGRITGIGGIFFKSPDPKALATWYRDVLGFDIENWGGALLRYDTPKHPPHTVWSPFAADTKYLAPSSREFMIDFAVDDLDAMLALVEAKGVKVLGRDDSDPSGRFAWIMDPDGTKIEFWQPKAP